MHDLSNACMERHVAQGGQPSVYVYDPLTAKSRLMAHTAESLQAAFKYLFPAEIAELQRLTNLLGPSPSVVNIGAGSGTSTLAILEARPDVLVTSIDVQAEDSPLGSLRSERDVVDGSGYGDRLSQIHGKSRKIGLEWFQDPISLLFIDGDHSLEGCAGDIICWIRNINDGGILAVHDYRKVDLYPDGPREDAPHPKPWLGVDTAVDMLLRPNFEMIGLVESLISFRMP